MHLKMVLLKPLGDYAEWRRSKMAGCYGGSLEDRYYERLLFQYLEEQEYNEEEELEMFNEEMDDAYLENMPYSPFPDLDSTYPSTPGK